MNITGKTHTQRSVHQHRCSLSHRPIKMCWTNTMIGRICKTQPYLANRFYAIPFFAPSLPHLFPPPSCFHVNVTHEYTHHMGMDTDMGRVLFACVTCAFGSCCELFVISCIRRRTRWHNGHEISSRRKSNTSRRWGYRVWVDEWQHDENNYFVLFFCYR